MGAKCYEFEHRRQNGRPHFKQNRLSHEWHKYSFLGKRLSAIPNFYIGQPSW